MSTVKLVMGVAEIMYLQYLMPEIESAGIFNKGLLNQDGMMTVFLAAVIGMIGMAVYMLATRKEEHPAYDYFLTAWAAIVAVIAIGGLSSEQYKANFLILIGMCAVNLIAALVKIDRVRRRS